MYRNVKPRVYLCPYCSTESPSKYAHKRHKDICRASPINQGGNRHVVR